MIITPRSFPSFAPLLLLALGACAGSSPPAAAPASPLQHASISLPHGQNVALGQRAYVDGPIVEAVRIVEDSRCPINARCVHAGRLRVAMVWHRPTGEAMPFIAELGERTHIADGAFLITRATGPRLVGEGSDEKIDYRFDFRFEGGY